MYSLSSHLNILQYLHISLSTQEQHILPLLRPHDAPSLPLPTRQLNHDERPLRRRRRPRIPRHRTPDRVHAVRGGHVCYCEAGAECDCAGGD